MEFLFVISYNVQAFDITQILTIDTYISFINDA